MTADEERRIREVSSLIEKGSDRRVVEQFVTELYDLLTKKLEEIKSGQVKGVT
jgi:hypothetical protein